MTAALEVVAEKGAAAASLDEVGARAAASRSQLYHYFDDKNDLLRAVAQKTSDTVLGAQEEDGRSMQMTAPARGRNTMMFRRGNPVVFKSDQLPALRDT